MADTGGKNPKDDNRGATRSHAEDGGNAKQVPNMSVPTDRSTKKEMEEKQNKNGKLSPSVSTSAAKQSGSSKFVNAKKAKFEQQQEHPSSLSAETHLENQTSNKAGIASKTDNLSGQSVCRTEENSQKFCVDERITVVEKEYKKETKSSETDQREDYKSEGTTGDSSLESGLKGEQMPGTTAGGSNYGATSSGHDSLYTKDLDFFVLVDYSKEISINIKWLCGKTVKLQIDPSDSIYSVKSKLGNPEGICLMFQDKELVEEKPLLYFEIKDGDTLYALNRQESAQSLQRDDEVLDDSGSHLSESNSVETISEEDHEEQMRDGENISIQSFNMISMTHIPGDNNTELKPHTELCSTQGTGDEIVPDVNNAAKMPETHNAEGEEEIKHFVDGDGSVKSEEHDAIQQVFETPGFSIEKVGNGYLLYRQNYPPVILPELEEASNVSVLKNMILIDNVPRYMITMKKGEITLSKIGVAKLEDNRSESSNTKRSEHNLSAETQEHKGDEEGLEMKKVRVTTPDMQNVLNPPQENETNPLNHQDTVADVNTGGSSGADVKKEEAKPDVDDELICKLQRMELEDVPRQQQQSLKEAVCKDDNPPIPAPRLKNKELLQKDDTVQLYSSSDSSESIVETISCEDLDEQIREWENSSTSSMTIITHIADDKEKNIKLETVSEGIGVLSLQGTDCVSGRKVDNAAKIPQTQIARGKEENKVPETLDFSIEKVGNRFILKCNNLVVKVPQLEGASGVSVYKDFILIDNEPVYNIKIDNGKVKISKIGDAECEVNRIDNNSTNNSGNNESGLYVESQQPQNVEEELDIKKVRGTTQDMQNVLNQPQENGTNPWNHHDTVADVKHTGSFDAYVLKERGKTAFDITREQQQSLEEAVSKDEKPPKPAARSKMKNAEKLENMSKSELTFKGYDGKKEGMTGKHVAISKRIVGASYQ